MARMIIGFNKTQNIVIVENTYGSETRMTRDYFETSIEAGEEYLLRMKKGDYPFVYKTYLKIKDLWWSS